MQENPELEVQSLYCSEVCCVCYGVYGIVSPPPSYTSKINGEVYLMNQGHSVCSKEKRSIRQSLTQVRQPVPIFKISPLR